MQPRDSIYFAYHEWLLGRADAETASEVERQLGDDGSELFRLMAAAAAETARIDRESGGLAVCMGRSFQEVFSTRGRRATTLPASPPPEAATLPVHTPPRSSREGGKHRSSHATRPPAAEQKHSPSTDPSELERRLKGGTGSPRRSLTGRALLWAASHRLAASVLSVAFLASLGTGTAFAVSTIAKSRRSEEVGRLVQQAKTQLKEKNREEALRLFGQAQGIAEQPVHQDAAEAVESLKRDIESVKAEMALVRSVGNLYRDSNRLWLDDKGIGKASGDYSAFFDAEAIPLSDPPAAAGVIRSKGMAGEYLVAAIDHWLRILYLTPNLEANKERLALASTLQNVTLLADKSEKSRAVRELLAASDLAGLQRTLDNGFGREVGKELHPETVGQLYGFLLSRGDPARAYQVANSAWWVHPDNPTVNVAVALSHRLGHVTGQPDFTEAARHYSTCVSIDRNNPSYWYNLAAVYGDLQKPEAQAHALKMAKEYNKTPEYGPPLFR